MGRRRRRLNVNRKRRGINDEILLEIISWSWHIGAAIFMAVWLVYFVGMRTSMIGVSMEPALTNGQQILVNRLSYMIFNPKPGDIVIFQPNGNRNSHYYIKRVVAGPGDRVQIRNGKLYINEEESHYEYDKIMDAGIVENEIQLKEDEFFVMGDNCNNSEDSRSSNIGTIRKEMIQGKAWFKFNGTNSYMGLIN